MAEDELISLIAALTARESADVIIGIGDDAAVLALPDNKCLVTCTDTLVAGVHFPAETPARAIGFKSLAVNLSDMAAMAASPRWAQLSLTMPEADEVWVRDFFSGFLSLADRHAMILVGGDTCCGPLSITVQVMGVAERDNLLTRGSAQAGDLIAVSGELGDAAFALQQLQTGQAVDHEVLLRLHQPEPRLELGYALAGIATSCIDLSDGLMLDLKRLLDQSGFGASVQLQNLPSSNFLAKLCDAERWQLQLSGGDDYELCFTISPHNRHNLQQVAERAATTAHIIGEVTSANGIKCYDARGLEVQFEKAGFQHFEDHDET